MHRVPAAGLMKRGKCDSNLLTTVVTTDGQGSFQGLGSVSISSLLYWLSSQSWELHSQDTTNLPAKETRFNLRIKALLSLGRVQSPCGNINI